MAMTRLGNGGKKSGKFTGLSIAQEFANAVCHFMRDHRLARPHEGSGKELPLDEKVWLKVLRLEYTGEARKTAQSLKAYCEYYNGATHGHGYDLDGVWDCGTGNRREKQRVGQTIKVKNRDKTVHPGTKPPYVKAEEVIEIVRERLAEIPTDRGHAAAAKLETQSGKRITSRKRAAARNEEPTTKLFSFADESAIEGVRRQVRWFARTRNRPLRDRVLAKGNGICAACQCDFSRLLGGKGLACSLSITIVVNCLTMTRVVRSRTRRIWPSCAQIATCSCTSIQSTQWTSTPSEGS